MSQFLQNNDEDNIADAKDVSIPRGFSENSRAKLDGTNSQRSDNILGNMHHVKPPFARA